MHFFCNTPSCFSASFLRLFEHSLSLEGPASFLGEGMGPVPRECLRGPPSPAGFGKQCMCVLKPLARPWQAALRNFKRPWQQEAHPGCRASVCVQSNLLPKCKNECSSAEADFLCLENQSGLQPCPLVTCWCPVSNKWTWLVIFTWLVFKLFLCLAFPFGDWKIKCLKLHYSLCFLHSWLDGWMGEAQPEKQTETHLHFMWHQGSLPFPDSSEPRHPRSGLSWN